MTFKEADSQLISKVESCVNVNGLENAFQYCEKGWKVFPVHSVANGICSCGKNDCKSQGKHPRTVSGFKDASTDLNQIDEWFSKYPDSNIGIATGKGSGMVVLDIDCGKGKVGFETLRNLEAQYGSLPETLSVKTGGGGKHYYFKYPRNGIGSKNGIAVNIDLKGDGGYVVAPPSSHISGNLYCFEDESVGIAELPEWISGLVNDPQRDISKKRDESASGAILEGSRNSNLTSIAGKLRHAGLGESEIFQRLMEVNSSRCNPPLNEAEVSSIAKSVSKYPVDTVYTDDSENADRFVKRYGENIRYCHDWKQWIIWNGRSWELDRTGKITGLADKSVRELTNTLAMNNSDQKTIKSVRQCLNNGKLKAMINLSEHQLPISADDLDSNKWLLNVNNGTLDLKTGTLLPHLRDRFITKTAPVEYDPKAECPNWLKFLDEIMEGNQEMVDFIQKAVGYSLTGETSEQCFFILHGCGRNGKSTFLEIIHELLGEYAKKSEMRTFLQKNNDSIRNDLATLKGARFVSSVEVNQNQALDESMIKEITGGDQITARYLFKEYFTFYPEFKVFLATNNKPRIKGTDNGIWRRIRFVPFDYVVPEDQVDRDLPIKLKSELPGILKWSVDGCLKWKKDGLKSPKKVSDATKEYRSEEDFIQEFLDDKCVLLKNVQVPVKDLYEAFKKWSDDNSYQLITKNTFGRHLSNKGFKSESARFKDSVVKIYKGIGLKTDQEPD